MGLSGLKLMSGTTAHILHQQGLIDLNQFTKNGGRCGHGSSSKQLTEASPTSTTPPPNQMTHPVLKTACMDIYSKKSLMMLRRKNVLAICARRHPRHLTRRMYNFRAEGGIYPFARHDEIGRTSPSSLCFCGARNCLKIRQIIEGKSNFSAPQPLIGNWAGY